MTSRAQDIQHKSGSGRSRKMRWLSGSSPAAAAFLLASAPQAAQAQELLHAPGMIIENAPHNHAPAGMVAINQAQAVATRASDTQAFQANVTSASADPTVSISSNADIVTVSGTETFINWSPLDTANSDDLINILPAGTSLTFVGPSAGYTVLNRILSTGTTASGVARGIAFGGNVTSRLGANTGPVGGNIWFYSPGGIVVGTDAVFDVGGLVLTTNDIDRTGGLFGAGGEIRFSGATDSVSSVIIENGATINALNDRSSYVAMVAPRIVQGGTVTVDGSVAYVAAEQANLTINNGLFDIAIAVGTTDANGVVHSGTTTGPSSTPSLDGLDADAQAIYMVAVPKNDALTMLVGGVAGYLAASSASIENGNIVLSAGGNVSNTGLSGDPVNEITENTSTTAAANIQIGGGSSSSFSSTVTMFASNQININTSGDDQILINGDVNLKVGSGTSGGDINFNIDRTGLGPQANTGLRIIGNLTANVSATGTNADLPLLGADATAGNIIINVRDGGQLTVEGIARFDVSAAGGDTNAGNGTGGDIFIHANNGSINFADDVFIDASGVGGVGGNSENPDSLGIGQGGAIILRVEGAGGNLSFTNLNVNSGGSIANDGEGGAPSFNGDGGFGFGGSITFDLLGGTFTANDIMVASDGSGGGGGDIVALPASGPASSTASQATPADLTVVNAPSAGGIPAGDGGDGQGGNVTFNLNGSAATVTNLTISANGFGGEGADGNINYGTAGGNGGRGIGGNATFNAQSGSLTITSTLTVSADGNNQDLSSVGFKAAGGFGYGSDGGAGGAGIGGTATFNLDGSATINAGQVTISTNASGGYGGSSSNAFDGGSGPIQAGIGGNGGDATGGDTTFNNNAGTLNFNELSVASIGTGGDGGDVSGSTTGEADNIAGNGGTGTGGNAAININQDDPGNPVYVVDASGVGGDGGNGLGGGDGGAAFGGIAAININNVPADLVDPTIIANATGGAGGEGRINPATLDAGNSGNGGSAIGGTARLQVTGASGNIDLGFILQRSNAIGGQGGAGYNNSYGDAGSGGDGGNAIGGRSEMVARTGGTINLTSGTFDFTSTGTGGAGGDGGYTYAYTAGDGGDGGFGTGGEAVFLAQGGTITAADVNFTVAGIGGNGGVGGTYGYGGVNGATGTGGTGYGGTAKIEVQEGSPGIITLGNVVANANGTSGTGGFPFAAFGGRIEVTDSSTDPAGLLTLSSLTANAFDTASGSIAFSNSTPQGGFYVTGDSGAMSILGDLTVNVVGNIEYNLDGDGQMTVGGNATLNSGQNILINHSNNLTPVNSIDVSGTFTATAQGDFISTDGSRINAADTATVRAEQNATVADIAGVGFVDISALFDVNVNNAAVTGTPTTVVLGSETLVLGPQMLIQAGFDPGGTPTPTPAPTPTPSYDPNYDATITGDVTSTGFIEIFAGGSALFSTGSNTVSDNGLTVQTGDDIIIQTGASVVAGNNPATTPNLGNPFPNINNLSLQAGSLTPLSTATITPIASIVAAGDIDANAFAVEMSANAIDGLGGTITASSLSADINDAPSNAVITATGQSDDNGLLSAQCVEGNICLGTLNADNLVHIGQASNNDVIQGIIESGTVSANDILVTTRRDILMGTDGIATVLDASNQFLVESTEGDVNLRDAAVSSASVLVSAVNGSLLGSGSLTSVNDIGISVAGDVNAAAIDTGGQLTTVALVGGGFEASYSVPANITVGSLTQGGGVNVNIIAGGDISFGQINLPADRSITLTAATGDAFLGSNSSATSISILGNNVGFNDLLSTGNITLNAAIGNLTGTGPGDLTANGTIDLDATGGSVTAGIINGGGGIDIASGSDVVVGALLGGFTDILATGAIDIGSADTLRLEAQGSSITLGTANITSNAFAASGALVLTATTGAIGIADATTARATTLDAATDVVIDNMTSVGAFGATAGGDISFTTLAGNSVTLNAGGNIVGGDLDASINTLSSNVAVLNAGGSVTAATINAVDGIDIDSSGDVVIDVLLGGFTDILTTGAIDIGSADTLRLEAQGSSITLGTANITSNAFAASGALVLTATTGGIGITDATTARATTLDAAADISIGSLAAIGAFGATAGGNIALGTASGESVIVSAGGNITGLSASAPTDTLSSNVVTLTAGGAINVNTINAANDVNLDAGGTITADSVQGDFIDAVGAGLVAIGSAAGTRLDVTGQGIDIGTANITSNAFAASGVINLDAGGGAANIGTANSARGTTIIGSSVRLDQGNIAGNLALNATAGDITGAGTVTVGGSIDLDATGNVGFGDLTAQGGTFTVDAGGNINFGNASSSSDLTINGANIDFDTASGNGIDINAIGNVLINSSVNAANDLQITAGGLIDIQGNAVGSNIMTVSSDMNIGPTGTLGQTDLTGDIQIFTDGTTQMVLGGANNPTGVFYLGNDEFSRIHSGGDLTLTAVPTATGGFDMVVQNLNVLVADNVSGPQSANIGLSNSLNLVSGRSTTVVGFVDFSNANANSVLNFTAGQDLFIDAASGIIQMTDASGNFSGSGSLSINAANVYAMTGQALTDIASLSAADIDLRLANNDGIDLPDGLIRADNVQIAVIDNLLIQNTANGTDFPDRRGFNVGTLSIAGPSTGNANIVINGIVGGATGRDTIPATNLAIGFDPGSTINGCVINNPAGCVSAPTPTPTPTPEIKDPVQDVIDEEVTPEKYAADPFATTPMEIKENADLADDPLIDEPVTGAGNDDLWVDEDEEDEEEEEEEPAE